MEIQKFRGVSQFRGISISMVSDGSALLVPRLKLLSVIIGPAVTSM